MKKSNWRCQHFIHVYQKLRSHYVCFFEIWSAIYTNFCYLGPIFALLHHYWLQKLEFRKMSKNPPGDIIPLHMCTKNGDHMMYCSWDIKAGLTEIFVILGHFLPFQPSNNSKNQHRMMYGLWDMERDRQKFLSYWAFFRYFAPLTNQKFKILKKMKKKAWRYNHFTQVYQKSWSYAILFLGYGA